MMSNPKKEQVFANTRKQIVDKGFNIVDEDAERPWGGFFVIDEEEAPEFAHTFFGDIDLNDLKKSGRLSPKILVVQPQKRLSWQYHHRRAEIWKVLDGPVGVMKSPTDEQAEVESVEAGQFVRLKQGERHRLVGLENWGILAEIWQHTDAENPSDEEDIVRLQDDFGR